MAHTDPHGAVEKGEAPGYATGHETRDVNLTGARRVMLVMIAFLALVFAFIWGVYVKWRGDAADAQPPASPVAVRDGDRLPPLPRLQTVPYADLQTFKASEDQVLTQYAWVDREQGVVRIPIARAIELVAERGLPPAGAAPAAPVGPATGGPPTINEPQPPGQQGVRSGEGPISPQNPRNPDRPPPQ